MALLRIPVKRLQIGMFIHLDSTWEEHPFLYSSFEIKNRKQINILLKQDVDMILYDPVRSKLDTADIDVSAGNSAPAELIEPSIEPTPPPVPVEEDPEMMKIRTRKLKDRRVSLNRCEKAFTSSVSGVKSLMNDLRAMPRESLEVAEELVGDMVDTIIHDQDATM